MIKTGLLASNKYKNKLCCAEETYSEVSRLKTTQWVRYHIIPFLMVMNS